MADDDLMFQDAVDALKRGDRARAKELLTLLLKADQNNATYWVWMSAAVETQKERIYCLQTALKLDAKNATAHRGLVLLGALPPDENIQPFRLDRPRAWEEKLLLAHEQPRPKGAKGATSNPITRLAGIGVIGLLVCGLAAYGLSLPRNNFMPIETSTPGPSPTPSPTPTLIGGIGVPTGANSGPTPLWALLPATYTPTPFYVSTPRAPQSADQYRVAKAAYAAGDWEAFVDSMNELARLEPDSADIHYFIGEAYRMDGNAREALEAYNDALRIDNTFGAAYLGLARARLLQDPNADVTPLFDLAVQHDPNFGEIYLERANYYLYHKNADAALIDLGRAEQRMPTSPLVPLGYAQAYLLLEDLPQAQASAEKANDMDITMLPAYLIMGETYVAGEDYPEAIEALATYTTYVTDDGRALALLGQSYFETQQYEAAIPVLTEALDNDGTQVQAFIYRGLSHLELGHAEDAQADMERAAAFYDDSLEIKIGLTRSYYQQGKYGSAFLQIEGARSLARTSAERALVLYWRALVQEQRGEIEDALDTWRDLLSMPVSAMSEEMRVEAELHIRTVTISTPTATPRPGGAPTSTKTPTRTPTRTPKP